ncbi:MAG: aldo/keto reductase [Treponema sp.]|nr:aldo/keto reductase [Treponema sp.]
MEYRRFRNEDTLVSLLGYGIMRMPAAIEGRRIIDREKGAGLIDYALDRGVNYFDTAYNYHGCTSEEFTGWALSRHKREKFYLATKMPVWMLQTREEMRAIFAEQLRKCRVDFFDFYLIHNFSSKNLEMEEKLGVYEFLRQKKEEGRIRRLGFSMHDTLPVLEAVLGKYDWDFAQLQINYMDWEALNAKALYEAVSKRGLPVIVMEPVRGGALAGQLCEESRAVFGRRSPERSAASWAIRFAANLPNVLTVLSGMSSLEQLQDNISTLSPLQALNDEEYGVIAQAMEAYRRHAPIPCTACRYCMDCPFGVDIPGLFALYNRHHNRGKTVYLGLDYRAIGEDHQVHHCKKCGKCARQCPQSLDIPRLLEMTGAFVRENALEDIQLLRPEEGVAVIGR